MFKIAKPTAMAIATIISVLFCESFPTRSKTNSLMLGQTVRADGTQVDGWDKKTELNSIWDAYFMWNALELSCSHPDKPFDERNVPLAIIRQSTEMYTTVMAAFNDVFTKRWNKMQSCSVTTQQLQSASIMPRK